MPTPHVPRPALVSITAVVAALAAVLVGVTSAATPVSAQARNVLVAVRTTPALPRPGDDVTARVTIDGCPPGGVVVETYLHTTDGITPADTLMTRVNSQSSVLWRTRVDAAINGAFAGWYGIRVICGAFRPPKEPMANTWFAVGAGVERPSNLLAPTVAAGATLRYQGSGCPGPSVEYQLYQGGRRTLPWDTTATIPTDPGGTWGADVAFPATLDPGEALVRARCVVSSPFGQTTYVYYDPSSVTVRRG